MSEIPVINPRDECTSLMGIVASQMDPHFKPARKGPSKPKIKPVAITGWKVAQCPSCGWIQVLRSKFKLYCKRCGRSFNLRKSGRWNVKIRLFHAELEATVFCQEWKKEANCDRS